MSDPLHEGDTHGRRSASAALANVSATALSGAIALVLSVVVARALGPGQYGRYAYLTYLLALVGAVATIGVPLTVLQVATAAFGTGNSARAGKTLASGTTAVLVGGAATAFVLVQVVDLPVLWQMVLVGGIVGAQWLNAASIVLAATSRVSRAALLTVITSLGSLAAGYVVAVRGFDGDQAFAVLTLQAALCLPVALMLVGRRWTRPLLTLGSLRPYLHRGSFENWVVGVGTLTVFSRLEVLALQHFDTPEHVAVYSVAFGLAARIATPVEALLAPLLPSLTALHEQEEWDRLRLAVRRSTIALATLGSLFVAATVPSVVAGATVLYGESFSSVRVPLLALGPLTLLKCLVIPATTVLLSSRRQAALVKAVVVALLVDVALAVALVPWMSIWGAVAANGAAQVIGTLVVLDAVFGKERKEILSSCRNVFGISLLAVLSGAAVALWQPTILGALLSPAVSLLVFAGAARFVPSVPVSELRWAALALPRWFAAPTSSLIRVFFGA